MKLIQVDYYEISLFKLYAALSLLGSLIQFYIFNNKFEFLWNFKFIESANCFRLLVKNQLGGQNYIVKIHVIVYVEQKCFHVNRYDKNTTIDNTNDPASQF
jgi:hypothetical protein